MVSNNPVLAKRHADVTEALTRTITHPSAHNVAKHVELLGEFKDRTHYTNEVRATLLNPDTLVASGVVRASNGTMTRKLKFFDPERLVVVEIDPTAKDAGTAYRVNSKEIGMAKMRSAGGNILPNKTAQPFNRIDLSTFKNARIPMPELPRAGGVAGRAAVGIVAAGAAASSKADVGEAFDAAADVMIVGRQATREKGLCHGFAEAGGATVGALAGTAAGVGSSPFITPAGGAVAGVATGMVTESYTTRAGKWVCDKLGLGM